MADKKEITKEQIDLNKELVDQLKELGDLSDSYGKSLRKSLGISQDITLIGDKLLDENLKLNRSQKDQAKVLLAQLKILTPILFTISIVS